LGFVRSFVLGFVFVFVFVLGFESPGRRARARNARERRAGPAPAWVGNRSNHTTRLVEHYELVARMHIREYYSS